jgi:hypothetical protein
MAVGDNTTRARRQRGVFKQIFTPTEKLVPTEKMASWQRWVLAHLAPTHCVGANSRLCLSWRLCEYKKLPSGHFQLGPDRSQAQAHTGWFFGLSPQARPEPAHQARPAKARARSIKPEPDTSPHFTSPLRPYFQLF